MKDQIANTRLAPSASFMELTFGIRFSLSRKLKDYQILASSKWQIVIPQFNKEYRKIKSIGNYERLVQRNGNGFDKQNCKLF
jgi:hypothetical protein